MNHNLKIRRPIKSNFALEWDSIKPSGYLTISNGKIIKIIIEKGKGEIRGEKFSFVSGGPCRLKVLVAEIDVGPGSETTTITVCARKNSFSFFLRDTSRTYPIFIPEFGVTVTKDGDERSYQTIRSELSGRRLQTQLQQIENQPEENYESAAAHTRNLICPTWLGLSRDVRIFEVGFPQGPEPWSWIQPRFHSVPLSLDNHNIRYLFTLGRGIGCTQNISRHMAEGVLPILTGKVTDEEIEYNFTAFTTLESGNLSVKTLPGTHFLVADGFGIGNMLTKEEQKKRETILAEELKRRKEETVLFFRVEIVNTGHTPHYAWFKNVSPGGHKYFFEVKTGFGKFPSGLVFSVSRLNGKPLPQEELAVLVKPGETVFWEFLLPHQPISEERAQKLAQQNFVARYQECRSFWKGKLKSAAGFSLPEKRVDEMVRAGLLHLDLVTYGLEPEKPVAPTIGVYCPIGSESAPIIQFMDSMGWHKLAGRALDYFLEKQHKNGFMQNFNNYMLETGAVLWSLGEHYRYTRDNAWVRKITPKLLKSCDYIIRWRQRNLREELRGKGYGLLEGKCADPEDPYHSFMLNGYAYLGLIRAAEMLSRVNPVQSARLTGEAKSLKENIRKALLEAIAKSPVVPLNDGTWCPTVPPWVETRSPVCLSAEKGNWFTHGTFFGRDSLLGPLWLVFQEVLEPEEKVVEWLLNYHVELMHMRNVAFSQPYYSRHDWLHLKRGEIKPFLKNYYNSFAGLADRETYTFWEHFFQVSPHKTHEEAWFLMQTRWMLYLEEGTTLKLLPGIPRSWLRTGNRIELNRVASYFGPLSVQVESKLDRGLIEARIECASQRQPESVKLRLPHPQNLKPSRVTTGVYDQRTETILLKPFRNKIRVTLEFKN